MRIFFRVFLLVSLVACGNYDTPPPSEERVGQELDLTRRELSGTDQTKLKLVCDALREKEAILPSAISSRHTFRVSQTDCEGKIILTEDASVVIQKSVSGYSFQKILGGADFIFLTIETTEEGLLKDVCGSLASFSNPLVKDNNVTYFSTSEVFGSNCPFKAGEECLLVEQAFLKDQKAIVHTRQWLRVRTRAADNKYIGFVTHRKKVTKSFCGNDEAITFKSELKTL